MNLEAPGLKSAKVNIGAVTRAFFNLDIEDSMFFFSEGENSNKVRVRKVIG